MSEPLAWLVEHRDSDLQWEFFQRDAAAAARLEATGDFNVTPLIAAPPEDGRPTYADLVEALRRLAGPSGFGCGSLDDSPACGVCAWCCARALLSRIPKEEP